MPLQPSVYSFEDESKKPLYIGKSIHPKTRIRQHLKASFDLREKQSNFVKMARFISFYPVASELESILLEARLVRLHQPKFNTDLKDDKSKMYIVVNDDDFPRIEQKRALEIKKNEFAFGPFGSVGEADLVIKIARKIFKFCKNPPKNGQKMSERPCFYYHLDWCSGACVGKISKSKYRSMVGYVKKFLGGQTKGLLKKLEVEIKKAAKKMDFEKANELKLIFEAVDYVTNESKKLASFFKNEGEKDKNLKSLKFFLRSAGIESSLERIEGYDIATLQQKDTVGAMVVFFLGEPAKSEYRKFSMRDWEGGDVGAMAEMINRRMRHEDWDKPDLILIDGGKPQLGKVRPLIPADIPMIGLAKKEETIIVPKMNGYKEYKLSFGTGALKLLQQVRDEAHRFATGYHKLIRARRVS